MITAPELCYYGSVLQTVEMSEREGKFRYLKRESCNETILKYR